MAYRCGDFWVDPSQYRLERDGKSVPLRPQVAASLQYLLERPAQVVSKQELLDAVWRDAVVTENCVSQCIKELRRLLGDDARQPSYIETVPRVGYRLIAEVEVLPHEPAVPDPQAESDVQELLDAPPAPAQLSPSQELTPEVPTEARSYHRFTGIGVLAGLLFLLAGWITWRVSTADSNISDQTVNSVAVFPFLDVSDEQKDQYLAEGFSQQLTSNLGKLAGLTVLAPSSASRLGDQRSDSKVIADRLHVQSVLRGSIRRGAENVEVDATLIGVPSDEVLWSEQFHVAPKQLPRLPKLLSQRIELHLLGDRAPTTVYAEDDLALLAPDVYENYLRGCHYLNQCTPQGIRKSLGYFQHAVQGGENFALAHAALADCWNMHCNYDLAAPADSVPQAIAAARLALEIDDSVAEGHISLAVALMQYEWDFENAEKHFLKSIELNPNDVTSRHWYAFCLMACQRFDEAHAQLAAARRRAPLSLVLNANIGWIHYFQRDYDAAISKLQEVVEMDPQLLPARLKLAWALQQKGRYQEAAAHAERARELEPDDPAVRAILAEAYAMTGRQVEAKKILLDLQQQSSTEYISEYWLAMICVALDDHEQAMECLEKAYRQRSSWLAWSQVDPKLDVVRRHERFKAIVPNQLTRLPSDKLLYSFSKH